MTKSGPKNESRGQPWTDREIAFILNHADWCIVHGKSYANGISDALFAYTSVRRTANAVQHKVRTLVIENQKGNTPGVFIRQGTSWLDLSILPQGILNEMSLQRTDLGLEALDASETSLSSIGHSGSSVQEQGRESTDDEDHARTSTHDPLGGRKRHHDDSDGSSDEYHSETPSDSDFVVETPEDPSQDKPKLIARLRSKPQRATAALIQAPPRSDRLSHSQHAPPHTKDMDTAASPADTRPRATKVFRTDEDSDEQNESDDDRPSPKKRQKSYHKVRASEPLEQVAKHPAIPEQTSLSFVTQKKHVEPHHLGLSSRIPSVLPPPPADNIRGQLKDISDVLFMLVRECSHAGQKIPPELEHRLVSIARTMEREPGCLAERILQDLTASDNMKKKLQQMLEKLITFNDHDRVLRFPKDPDRSELNEKWSSVRRNFKEAIVSEYPEGIQQPSGWAAGYVAARVDDLLRNDHKISDLKTYIEELKEHLGSVHTVQNFLSALLCHWLFATPDLFCEAFSSPKELRLFEAKLLSDGPEEVLKLDKIGAKQLFEDDEDEVQKNLFGNQIDKLRRKLLESLASSCPSAPGLEAPNDPCTWLKDAGKLKQDLLISSRDYRVHFCLPGTPYDSSWMKPEDIDGIPLKEFETRGKRVTACLFPALLEQEPAPFDESVKLHDVLLMNKKFFPSYKEKQAIYPKKVISKAFVLLE